MTRNLDQRKANRPRCVSSPASCRTIGLSVARSVPTGLSQAPQKLDYWTAKSITVRRIEGPSQMSVVAG